MYCLSVFSSVKWLSLSSSIIGELNNTVGKAFGTVPGPEENFKNVSFLFFLSLEIQGKQYRWGLNQGLDCMVKELELKLKAMENYWRFVSGGVTQIYLCFGKITSGRRESKHNAGEGAPALHLIDSFFSYVPDTYEWSSSVFH